MAQTDADEPGKSTDVGETLPDRITKSDTEKTDSISPDNNVEVENDGRGGRAALEDAVFWFHSQLDRPIEDHTDNGEHPDRPTTAREYWEDIRGFIPQTVDDKVLGWAPSNAGTELIHHLRECGHNREAILATGLFTEDLRPLWHGRYVIPYFDAGGHVVYAISRTTGKKGGGVEYDGHPADYMSGKYAKLAHTKDYVDVDEPIYGLASLEDGDDVVITEGILDAITAHEAGYACLSPVTTTFKHSHREALLEILDEHDIDRVYVVQDAEPPTSDLKEDAEGWDALRIEQFGEGIKGGATTAGYLSENDVDARLAKLPRRGVNKVDLDDYLHSWADVLGPVLASAVPPEQHPAYSPPQQDEWEAREQAIERARRQTESDNNHHQDCDSGLFDLDLVDVAPVSRGYRGTSPLGHHGESENYYVVLDGGEVGYDHKHSTAYNAITHLLCEIGERRVCAPEGPLTNGELLAAWVEAKQRGYLADTDPIPHAAIRHVAVDRDFCDPEDLEDGWQIPCEAYNDALVAVREQYDVDPGRDSITEPESGEGQQIIRTTPPQRDREPFDRKQVWDDLQGPVLDRCLDHSGVSIIAGPQGIGKTDNPQIGLDQQDLSYAVLFPTHEKAHESRDDSHTPEVDLHLKGAAQPLHDCCMDAVVAAPAGVKPECSKHGGFEEMPRMHPVYELDTDHHLRKHFENLATWRKVRRATFDLRGQIEGVTGVDPTESPWFKQFDEISDADHIVGVFPYATLSSLQKGHKIVIDDCDPVIGLTTHKLNPGDLHRLANALETFADRQPETGTGTRNTANAREFAEFARELAAIVAVDDDEDVGIADLSPPEIECVSIDDQRGVNRQHTAEKELLDETLAQLKVEYGEHILTKMRADDLDEWNGAVPNLDPLYAAAIEAGFESGPTRRSIALDWALEQCPRCCGDIGNTNGRRVCDRCGWDEAGDLLTTPGGEVARAHAQAEAPPNGENMLIYRALPSPTNLPDEPLIIGSNASAEPFAGLFDVASDDIHVENLGPFEFSNVHHCQITNGAYHKSTLQQSEFAQSHIQKHIYQSAQLHERVLYTVRKDIYEAGLFNFPDDDAHEVLTYHALAGLNRTDFDAVVLIGAPHPDVGNLRRNAELLTMNHDDLDTGGREYSTREGTEYTAYRKYDYDDGSGRARSGRAGATKAFTGLTGTLFDAGHAGELEQAAHRIRPILAGEGDSAFIYSLTNVPTDLPVDELVRLEELTDPITTLLPVAEGALELAEVIHDVATEELSVDGFRGETLADRLLEYDPETGGIQINRREATKVATIADVTTADGTKPSYETVCRWINGLDDLGLLNEGEYEQRNGVRFSTDEATLSRALSVVSSSPCAKVPVVRRFRAVVKAADAPLDWLGWARKALGLTGDRCEWDNRGDSPTRNLR